MPITHDTYLSATLARVWGASPNASPRKVSEWDRPRHDLPSHRATPPTPAGIAFPGQPAGAGMGRQALPIIVEKL
ncbi:hypothetical protein [Opitutus sp. GAS368]|jgi:hypothetical protein|uniref:hypothetical protein n=1 Tax=Opitutus sp. GAS368 TaxID=1882749 RepID=UPI00156198D8|nr:hypothetical protein [Opitutus sp. GAS368]